MGKCKDITGQKFGRLTAIKFSHKIRNVHYWLFKCDCGNQKVILRCSVKANETTSCGCYLREFFENGGSSKTHGMSRTKIYHRWSGMKKRCLIQTAKDYKHYGGRGITICKKWLKFENFYEDMGDAPKGKTLERLDNNKGYYKKNCCWATWKEQANNRRKRRIIN